MASITKLIRGSISVNSICKVLKSTSINVNTISQNVGKSSKSLVESTSLGIRNIHTTQSRNDLMEFFDDKKNWGESEVKSGRSWKKDELRIKSNTDLHKLWYILLKEYNMLLTMEQECKDRTELFPSPERIDKVQESMKNLEDVVRERNRAYHMLETGETGERKTERVQNALGLQYNYKYTEHLIPKELNKKWRERHNFNPKGNAVGKFLLHYREKLYNDKRKQRVRDRNHVMGLLKRFPNMDMEALKAQYPDVDIEKCLESKRARGHFVPK